MNKVKYCLGNRIDTVFNCLKYSNNVLKEEISLDSDKISYQDLELILEDINKNNYVTTFSGDVILLEDAMLMSDEYLISEGIFTKIFDKIKEIILKIVKAAGAMLDAANEKVLEIAKKILNSKTVKLIINAFNLKKYFSENMFNDCYKISKPLSENESITIKLNDEEIKNIINSRLSMAVENGSAVKEGAASKIAKWLSKHKFVKHIIKIIGCALITFALSTLAGAIFGQASIIVSTIRVGMQIYAFGKTIKLTYKEFKKNEKNKVFLAGLIISATIQFVFLCIGIKNAIDSINGSEVAANAEVESSSSSNGISSNGECKFGSSREDIIQSFESEEGYVKAQLAAEGLLVKGDFVRVGRAILPNDLTKMSPEEYLKLFPAESKYNIMTCYKGVKYALRNFGDFHPGFDEWFDKLYALTKK